MDKLAYSIKEAADALGISRNLMKGEISQERIFAKKIGNRTVIPRWALDEYLARPEPTMVVHMGSSQ